MPAGRPPNNEKRDRIVEDIIKHPRTTRSMAAIRLGVPYWEVRYFTDRLVMEGVLVVDNSKHTRRYMYAD